MIGITNAGGRISGNLKIRFYSGLNQPQNPTENAIWVKSSIPVSQWIMNKIPDAWVNVKGAINLNYESSGEYNMGTIAGYGAGSMFAYNGKLDGIYGQMFMKFTACYQSDGQSLHPVDAFVWNNYDPGSGWRQFSWSYNGELFANGNQYTEYTGGWVATANCQNGWYVDGDEKWIWPHAPALEISTVMKIWQTSNPWVGTVFTGKAVDVTNYSKLYVDLQYNCIGAGVNNGFNICVTKSNGNNFTPLAEYNVDTGNGNKSHDGTIAIDLSSISGEVYVAIASHQHGGVDTGNNIVNIRKIWRA